MTDRYVSAKKKMFIYSETQTTRDHHEGVFACRTSSVDLLTEPASSSFPAGDRKPGDTGMSDRRGRGEMAPKTGREIKWIDKGRGAS